MIEMLRLKSIELSIMKEVSQRLIYDKLTKDYVLFLSFVNKE